MNPFTETGYLQSTSGGHLHVEGYGTGRPLVLVHGWAMHSGIWREFARHLADKFRVICVDLPGHGQSGAVHPYNLKQIGNALFQAVPEGPCVWLGWSLGATVVLDFAHRYPGKVASLVLMAGNPRFISDENWPGVPNEFFQAFKGSLEKSCEATLLRFLGLQVQGLPDSRSVLSGMKKRLSECEVPDEKILKAGLSILRDSDLRGVLKQIKKPVMMILGERDALVPVDIDAAMKQGFPEVQVRVIKGAGHVPFLTHRQECVKIISNFIHDDERRF